MPVISVDLSQAQTFDPLPQGTYEAQVASVEPKTASTGTPMLEWQFAVTDDEYAGRKLFRNTPLEGNGAGITVRTLEAFGFDREEIMSPEGLDLDTDDLIGLPCRVVVTQRKYQGQIRNNVQAILPLEEGDVGSFV